MDRRAQAFVSVGLRLARLMQISLTYLLVLEHTVCAVAAAEHSNVLTYWGSAVTSGGGIVVVVGIGVVFVVGIGVVVGIGIWVVVGMGVVGDIKHCESSVDPALQWVLL